MTSNGASNNSGLSRARYPIITPCFSKRLTRSKQGVGESPTFFDKSILEILPLRCNSLRIFISIASSALFSFFSIFLFFFE